MLKVERTTNGIHTYTISGDDYNVYHKGVLIARERKGIVSWVSNRK